MTNKKLSYKLKSFGDAALAGAQGFIVGTVGGAVVISALGLLAHVAPFASEDDVCADYSLKNRFECAYCFDTPREHQTYTTYSHFDHDYWTCYYIASPYVTYPSILTCGLLGMGAMIAKRRKKHR